jgi:hypothetical protein
MKTSMSLMTSLTRVKVPPRMDCRATDHDRVLGRVQVKRPDDVPDLDVQLRIGGELEFPVSKGFRSCSRKIRATEANRNPWSSNRASTRASYSGSRSTSEQACLPRAHVRRLHA